MESMINKDECIKKRKTLFLRADRIRLGLLSFEKNEIDERRKSINSDFSFSNKLGNEKVEENKKDLKPIIKHISLFSKKTTEDSLYSDDDLDNNSSDLSSEKEEEI